MKDKLLRLALCCVSDIMEYGMVCNHEISVNGENNGSRI